MHDVVALYNLAMGFVIVVGLGYLAYAQGFALGYRRFFYFVISGFLVLVGGGPLADLYRPDLVHLVHGLAAALVIVGLYSPVHRAVSENTWSELLFREPRKLRQPEAWMVPMDDEILEVFRTSHLVLTPAIVALNIDRSRGEVNRRLTELTDHGLVERVDRGKYQLTEFGDRYLDGVELSETSLTDRLQSDLTQ